MTNTVSSEEGGREGFTEKVTFILALEDKQDFPGRPQKMSGKGTRLAQAKAQQFKKSIFKEL